MNSDTKALLATRTVDIPDDLPEFRIDRLAITPKDCKFLSDCGITPEIYIAEII